jgi:hypothetical protein
MTDDERRQAEAELARVRAEVRATPVRDLVANHAIGLWQLALIHLALGEEGGEPDLAEAKLAVDALAALVEGVGDDLGDHGPTLRDALTSLRLAYVQRSGDGPAGAATTDADV